MNTTTDTKSYTNDSEDDTTEDDVAEDECESGDSTEDESSSSKEIVNKGEDFTLADFYDKWMTQPCTSLEICEFEDDQIRVGLRPGPLNKQKTLPEEIAKEDQC